MVAGNFSRSSEESCVAVLAGMNGPLENFLSSWSVESGRNWLHWFLRGLPARAIAAERGEPEQISGKQELYESIINRYI